MTLKTAFIQYFTKATGSDPGVAPAEAGRVASLPLYLRSYYDIFRARIFDRKLLLAIQKRDTDSATPAEYAGHYSKLHAGLGEDVALVLPQLASYTRQQLLRFRVPFVVPDRQMFLPTLLVDLRERFPRLGQQGPRRLSAAAQVVLLRHLIRRPVEGIALRDLADDLGYSAMTLSNVRHELESADLCQAIQQGRRTQMVFETPRRDLWERAEPLLRDPVKARHWVRWTRTAPGWLRAGLTALADVSMVSDNTIPTYATKDSGYQAQMKSGHIVSCLGHDQAQAQIECWRYDPQLLADGHAVDRLSLFLSLRHTDDERVAQAVKRLVKDLPW